MPVEGWDFSWFEGRATEERPPWGYARLMGVHMAGAEAALDIETGGGEVLATVAGHRPPPPGGDRGVVAQRRGGPETAARVGARVVAAADSPALPFADASFDLVVSRHPVVVLWDEIARVLRPGGTYLSQQIGPGTNRELDGLLDGSPAGQREPQRGERRAGAEAAGLEVVDLRDARCGWSSSTSAPWSTSCARCAGRCRASRPRPTTPRSAACTRRSSGTAASCPRPRLLVEARRLP